MIRIKIKTTTREEYDSNNHYNNNNKHKYFELTRCPVTFEWLQNFNFTNHNTNYTLNSILISNPNPTPNVIDVQAYSRRLLFYSPIFFTSSFFFIIVLFLLIYYRVSSPFFFCLLLNLKLCRIV